MKFSIIFKKYGRFQLTFFITCLFQLHAAAQSSTKLVSTALHRVIFEKKDTVYKFYVLKPETGALISNNLTYAWYATDTILYTRGGCDGFILNGLFTIFYPNKNLKEEGEYVYGLKSGQWKYWFPDGVLKSVVNWKNGQKQGKFVIYDEKSVVIQMGNYKNDLMDGTIREISPDNKTEIKKYKKGQLKIQDSTSVISNTPVDNSNNN